MELCTLSAVEKISYSVAKGAKYLGQNDQERIFLI